jgi:hypothetical protein
MLTCSAGGVQLEAPRPQRTGLDVALGLAEFVWVGIECLGCCYFKLESRKRNW